MSDLLNKDIITNVRKDNCFDFLRYLFALSLIIAHFCTLTGLEPFWFITGSMRVKAFFTITGFLVTYSFLRRNCEIKSYAIKRFVRIVPAYVCCIIFCIFLGLFVTKLSVANFFSSAQTTKYTICNLFMLNWLEPELPSTFQDNLRPQMNGSLWSMKQEVIFYILVPFVIWILRKSGKRVLSVIPVAIGLIIYNFIPVQLQYFLYFFSGMLLLLFMDEFCNHTKSILLISFISELILYTTDIPYLTSFCQTIEPLTFSSIIVGIAYNCTFLNFFRKYDNVTYGLYLYHFPIIQLLILYGLAEYNITLCLIVTILITAVLACISWYAIEKPLITRYKYKGR